MKKRNEWVRKNLKRKKKRSDRGIIDFMQIMHHFFKELPKWINEMADPRHSSYITYTQADLMYMGDPEKYMCCENHAGDGRKIQ